MSVCNAKRPLLLGRLAVFASDSGTARRGSAFTESQVQDQGLGTVRLDKGDEVDWVDMGRGVVAPGDGEREAQ